MYLTYLILFTGQTDVGNDRQAQSRLVRTCLVYPTYVADRSKSLRPEVLDTLLDVLSTASAGQVQLGLLGHCLVRSTDPVIRSATSRSAPSPELRARSKDIKSLDHTHRTHLRRPRFPERSEVGHGNLRRFAGRTLGSYVAFCATQREEDTWKILEGGVSTTRMG
jgi:hypothetical protein